jgi:GMP synthase (glutamine-hydrolysing)
MEHKAPPMEIVLIQVRENAQVAQHERDCFVDSCKIDPQRMRHINLVDTPNITWSQVSGADVVLIGGAAAHSVTETYDFTAPLTELVCQLADASRPTFGSCWGHQFIAQALGGEVITDHTASEVGSFRIHLTEEGSADPLFEGYPPSFIAHMGHHDRISELPPGAVELARSDRCDNQIFRIADKPIYGAQFHAEMTAGHLIERLSYYRDDYLPSDEEFDSLKENPIPTPESDAILRRFFDLFAARGRD